MKKLMLAALVALAATVPASAAAQGQQPSTSALTVPVVGTVAGTSVFSGTFQLTRFVATETGVVAQGLLTGTFTDPATGAVTSIVRNIAMPLGDGTTGSCDILHLELGPLDLDLLGLQVHLNKIVLDIDAEAGPGNLLGNLLCSVAGLLDNPTGLARVLNEILAILR